jgi:hypothetical protein
MAAWKCINDFSPLSSANIRTGPEMCVGDGNFKLKPALIHMGSIIESSKLLRYASCHPEITHFELRNKHRISISCKLWTAAHAHTHIGQIAANRL